MRITLKDINPMLLDLICGCILYGIMGELIIVTIVNALYEGSLLKVAAGFLLGVLLMIALTIHMYYSVDASLSLGETGALKHTRKMYGIRIAIVLAVFAFVYFTSMLNAIAMVCGMISLKVAAYIQPFTHRYIVSKIQNKGR